MLSAGEKEEQFASNDNVICLLIFQALTAIGSCDLYIQTFGWLNEKVFFFDHEYILSGDALLLQKPLTPTAGFTTDFFKPC